MGNIKITWLEDNYDCEDCGWSYAQGAIVSLNNEDIIHKEPCAHCYNGEHWEKEEILKLTLEKLGYKVEEEDG